MKVLLDTCALIWAVARPELLPEGVSHMLQRTDSMIFFSPISCAEVACLSERGKIVLDRHWRLWFNHFTVLNGWRGVDIGVDIIQEAYSLPGNFHQDPADRIIVATARLHDLHLATGDRKILDYPHVKTIPGIR